MTMILEHLENYAVVLASKSPRRQELLKGMGIRFTCLTKDIPEDYPEMPVMDAINTISLPQNILSSMINQTIFAVADTDVRPI